MGVTVRAFSRMHLTEPHDRDEAECWDDHYWAFAYRGFEQSFGGLPDDPADVDRKHLGGRCYEPTADTKRHTILDMSYSGFGYWRETLSRSVLSVEPIAVWSDPDAWRDQPFFEVINFADNEGCIGPEACADLLADFQNPDSRATYAALTASLHDPDEWMAVWDSWLTGLPLAVDGGFVRYS